MPKVGQITVETTKESLDIFTPFKPENHQNSEYDTKLVWHLLQRFTDMKSKRTSVDKNWKLYQQMWESVFIPYSDGRSRSNVPIEMALVEMYVAESQKRKPMWKVEDEESSYKEQARIFEKVWSYDWSKNERNKTLLKDEYICPIFGTSVIYTGYESTSRVIKEMDAVTSDIKFKYKLQTKNQIIIDSVDIRNFYLDDKATCIDNATDCIYIEYIAEETFRNYKLNPFYKNIDSVGAEYTYKDNQVFTVTQERWVASRGYVKLTHYWNKESDMYVTMANEKTIIRNHPIINASKSLPFAMRQFSYNPFSAYGRGLCEILMPFKSDLNTLREMLMDAIKRSNNQVIAVGGNLQFDGNYFAYNNQVLKFNGDLNSGNFQQLQGNPPNNAIFSYMESIFKDIAIYSGIDVRNILGFPSQTAYQTAIQKESSLQRINVILDNRDVAYQRVADLHKDNLQMFFPLKLVRKLVPLKEDGETEEVEEGEEEVSAEYPKIPVSGGKIVGKKFVKTKWSGAKLFEITPEMIRGSIMVSVYTNKNAPTLKEVEKEQKMTFYTKMAEIMQAYAVAPELEEYIPKKSAIREMADLYDIETVSGDDAEIKKEKEKLISEIQAMLPQGGWMPPMWPEMNPEQAMPEAPRSPLQSPAEITNL